MEKAKQNDEAAENNDIDPVIDEEEPNFSDPEDYTDDITDEGNLTWLYFSGKYKNTCTCLKHRES